jgi:hypothetical protein
MKRTKRNNKRNRGRNIRKKEIKICKKFREAIIIINIATKIML